MNVYYKYLKIIEILKDDEQGSLLIDDIIAFSAKYMSCVVEKNNSEHKECKMILDKVVEKLRLLNDYLKNSNRTEYMFFKEEKIEDKKFIESFISELIFNIFQNRRY